MQTHGVDVYNLITFGFEHNLARRLGSLHIDGQLAMSDLRRPAGDW